MSDDLVKRYSSYNIMMLGDSGNEVSTPDGEWVKYKDYKAQAERIEELEAELEYWREESDLGWDKAEERRAELSKAVGFIQNFALRAMIEEHDEDERDMIDFDSLRFERDCDIVQARTTLAELKGEQDEVKKYHDAWLEAEAQVVELEAQVEGCLAVIATERDEVLALRRKLAEAVQGLEDALEVGMAYSDDRLGYDKAISLLNRLKGKQDD